MPDEPTWPPRQTDHQREDRGETEEPIGLVCPRCGCRHFYVIYTRRRALGRILRRRECRHCGRRITTTETEVGR